MFAEQLLIARLLISVRTIGERDAYMGMGREFRTSRLQGVQEDALTKVAIT
jgi:hypothetical protein